MDRFAALFRRAGLLGVIVVLVALSLSCAVRTVNTGQVGVVTLFGAITVPCVRIPKVRGIGLAVTGQTRSLFRFDKRLVKLIARVKGTCEHPMTKRTARIEFNRLAACRYGFATSPGFHVHESDEGIDGERKRVQLTSSLDMRDGLFMPPNNGQ